MKDLKKFPDYEVDGQKVEATFWLS